MHTSAVMRRSTLWSKDAERRDDGCAWWYGGQEGEDTVRTSRMRLGRAGWRCEARSWKVHGSLGVYGQSHYLLLMLLHFFLCAIFPPALSSPSRSSHDYCPSSGTSFSSCSDAPFSDTLSRSHSLLDADSDYWNAQIKCSNI